MYNIITSLFIIPFITTTPLLIMRIVADQINSSKDSINYFINFTTYYVIKV
jgi:hypothetical protein